MVPRFSALRLMIELAFVHVSYHSVVLRFDYAGRLARLLVKESLAAVTQSLGRLLPAAKVRVLGPLPKYHEALVCHYFRQQHSYRPFLYGDW